MKNKQELSVKLRRLEQSDSTVIATLLNNQNVWNNLRDYIPKPYHAIHAAEFITSVADESPHQTFGIITGSEELCGVITLVCQSDVYRLSAEIGYWIGEPYWRRGIATQAIGLITEYGFNDLHLERVYAGVFEKNKASMRALEKNGYVKEGVFHNSIIKNGILMDEYRYAKLRDQGN